jgi:hypothetical protein
MSDIEYEFKPSESGHTVWIVLKTAGRDDTWSWALTAEEFREFFTAAFRAHCSASRVRRDNRLEAIGYANPALAPVNYHTASGGEGGPQQSSIRFEQPSPPRKKKAHETIAEIRDDIFRRYGIR